MTRSSRSHKGTHALNATTWRQAAGRRNTEGLQKRWQRSGVMSLDTLLSQHNKAGDEFTWHQACKNIADSQSKWQRL